MPFLKVSTTATIVMGPFVDAGDGVTEETALTPAVEVKKAGGSFAARNSATAVSHDAEGWYDVELNATDTNTLGRLTVKAQDSANHLPVYRHFQVVPAHVYDGIVSGTDFLQVDTQHVGGAAPDSSQDLVDELMAEVIEGTYTFEDMIAIMAAALAGKVSGAAGTNVIFRNLADTLDRIDATVDPDGNRTAVTHDTSDL